MNASLRRFVALTLGLALVHAAAALGQELEFRPVPRPVTPPPLTTPAPAPIGDAVSIGGVVPASYVARSPAVADETVVFAQDPMKAPDPLKVPGTTPIAPPPANWTGPTPKSQAVGDPTTMPIPRQMPQMNGAYPGAFGPTPIIVSQPTIVGQPTIVSQPTIVGQSIVSGASPYGVSSGEPMSYGSCNSCGTCSSCGTGCDSCGTIHSHSSIFGNLFGGSSSNVCGNSSCCDSGCGTVCSTCSPCGDSCSPCCEPPPCCDPCPSCGGCCGPRSMFWARGEFMVFAFTRQNAPVLATSGATANNLPLGAGSSVLFDASSLPHSPFVGGKFDIGFWFPNHSDFGLDVGAFFFVQRQVRFSASGGDNLAIGRPFIEESTDPGGNGRPAAPTGTQTAEITGAPGIANGTIGIVASTRAYGFDPNLRMKLLCGPNWWLDGLVGYRYFELDDSIAITENITPNQTVLPGVQSIVLQDSYATRNTFNGAQVGLEGEWRFLPRWSLGGSVKIAAGDLMQQIRISGGTNATFTDGTSQNFPAGFFTQRSNIGNFTRHQFSVLPELGLKVNFDVTDHLRLYAGYDVMYLANVVRAGDQIDTRINSSQAPLSPSPQVFGPPLPSVLFKKSDFWAQGVNFGLEYHY
jgi:hypothetical protein